jgi:hypothetical protein
VDTTVKFCEEFALIVIGDAGVVDVPAGRPEIAIETDPLNPFDPTIETVSGTLVLPCTKLTEVDENRDITDTEKSCGGGGGVVGPEPQLAAMVTRTERITKPAHRDFTPLLLNPRILVNSGFDLIHLRSNCQCIRQRTFCESHVFTTAY